MSLLSGSSPSRKCADCGAQISRNAIICWLCEARLAATANTDATSPAEAIVLAEAVDKKTHAWRRGLKIALGVLVLYVVVSFLFLAAAQFALNAICG